MIQRRVAVFNADSVGDDEITKARLYDLQQYVNNHMNTSLGNGIYLESSYKEAVQTAYSVVANDSDVYQKAQEVCAPKFASWSQAYVQCTKVELDKYTGNITIDWPNPNMYLHTFISPIWSPDFAGLSVLVSVVLLIVIVIKTIGLSVLKLILKRHNSSI